MTGASNPTNVETGIAMRPELTRAIRRRFRQVLITILIQGAILIGVSGRTDWVMAWVYVGCSIGLSALIGFTILKKDPELIAERGQVKEGAKRWDMVLALLVGLLLPLAILVVAALDKRLGWSPQFAVVVQVSGVVLLAGGIGLFFWAMASNRFFSGIVRIQVDRGHSVQTAGPYRYVRHPGYVGMTLIAASMPLMFSSYWAFVPAGLMVIGLFVRTALEDVTLLNELDGYRTYANQVRFRLLPGAW
jgi:protein-S-isoprenylcysteine O-methyltransferase Ste14